MLRQRGLVAMTALRLVPLAPFAVEGVIAGAIRITLRDFMLGTALGMLPGTLAATVFGDQLEAALRDPADVNLWLIAGVVVGSSRPRSTCAAGCSRAERDERGAASRG